MSKRTLLGSVLFMLAASFAGCQTMGESIGLGAATGAAAGAAVGSSKGKTVEGALIGGTVGGAAGAIVHEANKPYHYDTSRHPY